MIKTTTCIVLYVCHFIGVSLASAGETGSASKAVSLVEPLVVSRLSTSIHT